MVNLLIFYLKSFGRQLNNAKIVWDDYNSWKSDLLLFGH